MEMLLLAVTIISLIAAFIMSAVAWRFGRDARTRSAARVAALAAAANETTKPATIDETRPQVAGDVMQVFASEAKPVVNEIRHVVAAEVRPTASDAVAVNDSRPWPPARVSTFSPRPVVADDLPLTTATLGDGFLGSAVATPTSGGRQRGLAIAAMFLFVAASVGGYWAVFGDKPTVSAAPAVTGESPLELVSLRHERRGPRLDVTGLVRNPVAGGPVDKLSAVVFLFDQQGAFVTSARAGIDYTRLVPGDESPFVISVGAPANVSRYRVSFRNDAGVVPHVDRRGQEPIAASGAVR